MRYIIIICCFTFCSAQVFSQYDYTGSRSTAMSGAVTSGPGGSWSIYHNPAQLANLEGTQLNSGYSKIFGFDFLPYYTLGFSYNNWAINIEKMSTEINSTELSSESVIGLAKGFLLYEDQQSSVQFGTRINIYDYNLGMSSGIDGDGSLGSDLGSGQSYGFDIGFQGVLNSRYYIAYYLQNINSPTLGRGVGNHLPKSITIGLSYRPYNDLLTSLDVHQLSGNNTSEVRFGIEYFLNKSLILRTGIQSNPNRFSSGLSYKLTNFDISYAFITHHIMPTTHQLSLSYRLK
jgi:hypothetical protein|tara:strand:- start:1115 stop:1981 length:867 start_codon:yes stop_codon:yes gene_type:complete